MKKIDFECSVASKLLPYSKNDTFTEKAILLKVTLIDKTETNPYPYFRLLKLKHHDLQEF